jgi:flagellar protein FliL
MRKVLQPKILIPVVVVLLLAGLVLYVVFAPATWWKPVYVRLEMDPTPVAQPGAQQAQVAPVQAEPSTPAVAHGITNLPPAESGTGIMYKLDTKVVNLADPGGLRYLQTVIVLEFHPILEAYYQGNGEHESGDGGGHGDEGASSEDGFISTIDARRPIIDDLIMTTLSDKTYSEIATVEGKADLKKELISAINSALGYEGVTNIYFTDFVVQ